MQNKFGLKDFVLLVVMLVVGLAVWLKIYQEDRVFTRISQVESKVDGIDQRLGRLQTTLESGELAVRTGGPAAAAERDESWARPGGAPVVWWPVPGFQTDPTGEPDFTTGGTFTEIFEAQPPTFTPYRYADVYGGRVVDIVCESLGRYNPRTLELEGVLAEAWQYDPEGMWLRAKIRPNARFSDGAPLTAEDIRFTFHDIIFNPEIEADRFRSTLNVIDHVEVVSDDVVDFVFKEPMFSNLDSAVTINILPKHIYSQYTPTQINESTGLVIGSGPFKLESFDINNQWKPGDTLRLVRNEAYWGRKPPLESLQFFSINDSLALLTAFTNKEGDMMRPRAKQFAEAQESPNFAENFEALKWYNMRGGYSFIAWQCGPRNGRLTPFHDARVRLAMTYLIDRERIRRDIERGVTRLATGPFSPETEQSNPDIKPWPHDVNKAKELLAEAGWLDRNNDGILENERGDQFRFQFSFAQGSEGTLQMATLIKDECAAVGIICDLNPFDWAILADLLIKRDFDAVTFAWSANSPESDPRQIWHSSQIDGQGDNFIQWSNPEADRLIDLGRRTIDHDKRMEIWHQLHTIMHNEQPYTFMSDTPWLRFVNKRVGNVQTYKSGIEYSEFYIRSGAGGAAAMLH